MGIQFPGVLSEALGMMGVQFPGTDEDALTQASPEWESMSSTCDATKEELYDAMNHVMHNNNGPAVRQYLLYMGDKSNITGTEALGEAADGISAGAMYAGTLVKKFKVIIIAEATAVKVVLDLARATMNPVLMVQAHMMAKMAGARVRTLDNAIAQSIRSGG